MNNLLLVLLITAGCSTFKPNRPDLKLTILHTNDHHGHYLADSKGQAGMSARKTLIDRLRLEVKENHGHSLLLSGGDINTGTLESDMFKAEPDFKGMREIGYDAMAVGNHEFDNSFKTILKQKEWAGFPFLAANIFYKGSDKRVFNPGYIIKNFNGIKIGIFGLTTKDTPFKASHQDAQKKFDFLSIIEVSKKMVKVLKEKEQVNFIVVVTHVGHRGSTTSNGDVQLAKAVDGIDVIVGGHSQEKILAQKHNGAIIVQAEDWGKYVGRLELVVNKDEKHMVSYNLIPVNLKKKVNGERVFIEAEIKKDEKLVKLFTPFKNKAEKFSNKTVAKLDRVLPAKRIDVRTKQVAVAQFMGEALIRKVPSIDAAVVNGGALRNSLEAGDISRKSLHMLHPYGNTIAYVKFNPEEFFSYMESISQFHFTAQKGPIGGNPHFIGVKLKFKNKSLIQVQDRKNKWSLKKVNGKLVGKKKSYTVSNLNFTARGGDNYPDITKHKTYVDTGYMINAAMMDYAADLKIIKASDYEKLVKGIIQNN